MAKLKGISGGVENGQVYFVMPDGTKKSAKELLKDKNSANEARTLKKKTVKKTSKTSVVIEEEVVEEVIEEETIEAPKEEKVSLRQRDGGVTWAAVHRDEYQYMFKKRPSLISRMVSEVKNRWNF